MSVHAWQTSERMQDTVGNPILLPTSREEPFGKDPERESQALGNTNCSVVDGPSIKKCMLWMQQILKLADGHPESPHPPLHNSPSTGTVL